MTDEHGEAFIDELKEALRYAIGEADGWYDDSRGGRIETEEMQKARELLDSD